MSFPGVPKTAFYKMLDLLRRLGNEQIRFQVAVQRYAARQAKPVDKGNLVVEGGEVDADVPEGRHDLVDITGNADPGHRRSLCGEMLEQTFQPRPFVMEEQRR